MATFSKLHLVSGDEKKQNKAKPTGIIFFNVGKTVGKCTIAALFK